MRNRIEAKNNNLRIETEQVTLSLYAGRAAPRQALLPAPAVTQVLFEKDGTKKKKKTKNKQKKKGVTQSFAFGKGRTGADKVAV